jgi:hypothetical protein
MTASRTSRAQKFWDEQKTRYATMAGGAVLFLVLLVFGLDYQLALPAKPPRPKVTAAGAAKYAAGVDRTPEAWLNYLRMDARGFAVPAPSPDELSDVFAYRSDEQARMLDPKGQRTLEAAGLRLTVAVKEQSNRHKKLLVLQIENLTGRHLAYRVETYPTKGTQVCADKEDLTHNAMALAPGGMEMRSECIYRDDWKLKIKRVETVELGALSFHYVSSLAPAELGYERRASRGHAPPSGRKCSLFLPAAITRGVESGDIEWRDLIDFYARHRCQTYAFPVGYKAFGRPKERPLPAAPARR